MTERIQIPCSQCGATLGAPADAAGKQVRCPKCKTAVSVPHSAAPVRRARRVSGDDENVQPSPRRNTQAPPTRKSPPVTSREQRKPESTGRPGSANSSERKVKRRQPVEDNLSDDLDEPEYLDEPFEDNDHYGTKSLPPRKKSTAASPRRYESTAGVSSDSATGGSKEIVGGILTMAGAVVWFVVGFFVFDLIFFYPPIMFVLGFIAFMKGIFSR